MSTLNNMLGIT